MGQNEYMLKFFMTPAGSEAFGASWGYVVKHHDQTAFGFTQNFIGASRFRDMDAAQRCVEQLKAKYPDFDALVSKIEYMSVRE